MAEARRWRELAAQAPEPRRAIFLSRADACKSMAIRSVAMPPIAD